MVFIRKQEIIKHLNMLSLVSEFHNKLQSDQDHYAELLITSWFDKTFLRIFTSQLKV